MKYRKRTLFQNRYQYNRDLWILYIGIFIVICILTVSGIFFSNRSKAAEKTCFYKYYTSVEIRNGDTLWSIASEYVTEEYDNIQEYVTEIKSLNDLKGDTIHTGQFLIVPYYSYELK